MAIFWSESREDWDDPILESPAAAAEPIDHLADLDPVSDEMEDEGFSSDWIQQAVFTVGYLHDEEAGAGASQRGANL